MSKRNEILLSVGIIFKNEIRCLERCLKALQPICDAIPCEVVMADTGSTDGSREVAEKYADIVFDFPWINDFAAARNAVMDRCSGRWFLTVDSDEWLDKDISQLAQFVCSAGKEQIVAAVTIRNYRTYEIDSNYADFLGVRLLRMSTGIRYHGAIHEAMPLPEHTVITPLLHTVLHHDGYVGFGGEAGKAKLERNMALLREKIKEDPNSLMTRLQIIESGWAEKDYTEQLRKAVSLVRKKVINWDQLGPPILRYAVSSAQTMNLDERDKWLKMAEEWFPDSYYTRIDIEAQCILSSWEKKDYADCISRGVRCIEAYSDYRAGRGEIGGLLYSTLKLAPLIHEQTVKLIIANAYLELNQPEAVPQIMENLDYSQMDEQQAKNSLCTLRDLHSRSKLNTASLVKMAWEGINQPVPNKNRAMGRRAAFLSAGITVFHPSYRENEALHEAFSRHGYTLFLPLAGQCELGTAAMMMEEADPKKLEVLCCNVEHWNELPVFALSKALTCGMMFPLPGKALKLETMDMLASELVACEGTFQMLEDLMKQNIAGNRQTLVWVRGLVLAFIRVCLWRNAEQSMALARYFAQIEKEFLPLCYAAESLCKEGLFMLPPIHRLGWYCVQAFDALDAGNTSEYVRFLRNGLAEDETANAMVEFLLEYTPQLQAAKPTGELLALAEKVREMLAAYAPDDPAVVMIKQSTAYQKVAQLIEGPAPGVWGGLAQ